MRKLPVSMDQSHADSIIDQNTLPIPPSQNGCCFRAHSISTNDPELSKQVHSTLLRLPDSIYTPDPAAAGVTTSKDKKRGDSNLRQSIQRELEGRLLETPKVKTTLLSLLQTEHTKPRHSTAPIQENNTSIGSSEASADTVAISSSSSSTATSSTRQQSRIDAVSVSDMEEDEEDDDGLVTPQYVAGRNSKRRGNPRQRHYRHEGKG